MPGHSTFFNLPKIRGGACIPADNAHCLESSARLWIVCETDTGNSGCLDSKVQFYQRWLSATEQYFSVTWIWKYIDDWHRMIMVFNILAVWFQSSVMFQTWPDVIWECTLVVWGGIGVCSWGRCACATVNTGYRRPQYTQRDVHTNFSHAHFYIKRNLLSKMAISLHIMRLLSLSQNFKKYSPETIFSIKVQNLNS